MKCLMSLFLVFCGFLANAQNGTKYFSLKGGIGVRGMYMGSLSFDYNTKYYNQHEIFAEFMESRDTGYQTFMGGAVIKPVITRGTNSTARWRLGAGIGTDSKKFVAAPQAGWEFSQTFSNRVELILENTNQAVLWAPKQERWRFMFVLGVRISLN